MIDARETGAPMPAAQHLTPTLRMCGYLFGLTFGWNGYTDLLTQQQFTADMNWVNNMFLARKIAMQATEHVSTL